MKKILIALSLMAGISSCKKSSGNPTQAPRTVQSIAGVYSIQDLTYTHDGSTVDVLDSLKPCERDNEFQFNLDLTSAFIDAGIVCAVPEDVTGNWSLTASTDSLYLEPIHYGIKSWDGQHLELTQKGQGSGFNTVTLLKQ